MGFSGITGLREVPCQKWLNLVEDFLGASGNRVCVLKFLQREEQHTGFVA